MQMIGEFRNPELVKNLCRSISRVTTQKWKIMEICGGQTHSILHYGLDQLLPPEIELLHGPGCPVCVTPSQILELAFKIALQKDVIFCTFADMIRVPGEYRGSQTLDFYKVRAMGGDVRMVQSPLEAVNIAKNNPEKEVVFFAVGFETTTPVNALAVNEAEKLGLSNMFFLVSQVLVPPALEALLGSPDNQIQGVLAAGHVCSIMGTKPYVDLAEKYQVPCVITGFEPTDLLQGIYLCIKQMEDGRSEMENQYSRVVKSDGNFKAQELMQKYFQVKEQGWRGLGRIADSGYGFRNEYAHFDAEVKYQKLYESETRTPSCEFVCRSGEVLVGRLKPTDCEHFGKICNPSSPLGPTMVSTEGACAAYFKYRNQGRGINEA
ncbi:MAG: hydrogenase formation protein HypD [Bdellovibrionaceae bacterium]|nr:hydrogenase formation protein HypD [Pseudobdellovibrionaceae bacterium]